MTDVILFINCIKLKNKICYMKKSLKLNHSAINETMSSACSMILKAGVCFKFDGMLLLFKTNCLCQFISCFVLTVFRLFNF